MDIDRSYLLRAIDVENNESIPKNYRHDFVSWQSHHSLLWCQFAWRNPLFGLQLVSAVVVNSFPSMVIKWCKNLYLIGYLFAKLNCWFYKSLFERWHHCSKTPSRQAISSSLETGESHWVLYPENLADVGAISNPIHLILQWRLRTFVPLDCRGGWVLSSLPNVVIIF